MAVYTGKFTDSYLGKLQALSITFILAALVLSHKLVILFNVQFSIASLIFPNTMLIANIIAVVYGYKHSSEIMWETLKCQIPSTLICLIAIKLPSPSIFAGNAAYEYVFNDMWQISLASLVGTYVGLKANIYVLSKSNFLLLYKGFWLRTLFACGVGEFVFTVTAVPMMFFNKVSFSSLISIITISLIVKIIYSSLLSYLSQIIALKLMKNEKITYGNSSFNYDPFIIKNSSLT
jgi:uncharacterized integral membrane protein (TIGR00697 family)